MTIDKDRYFIMELPNELNAQQKYESKQDQKELKVVKMPITIQTSFDPSS